ncbi:hypothetical protein TCSYLVIO_009154, partial [Trypanosoma cruzi]
LPPHAAAMRSRCAATSATSSLSQAAPCPPRPSQSPPCHRHAQHTQRHNVVPPLCPNHEHNAQRVMAHVCHALQPHADQPHRHALLLVVLLVGAHLPSSQSTAWCYERLSRSTMRVKFPDVRKQRPPSYISAHSAHQHTRAVSWGRETQRTAHAQINMHQQRHPRRAAVKSHAHGTNTAATNGMHPTPQRGPSLLPSPADWRHTLTVRHGAHHPLPSECTQQAGAQSSSCHRNGEHKQSSPRTIGA